MDTPLRLLLLTLTLTPLILPTHNSLAAQTILWCKDIIGFAWPNRTTWMHESLLIMPYPIRPIICLYWYLYARWSPGTFYSSFSTRTVLSAQRRLQRSPIQEVSTRTGNLFSRGSFSRLTDWIPSPVAWFLFLRNMVARFLFLGQAGSCCIGLYSLKKGYLVLIRGPFELINVFYQRVSH